MHPGENWREEVTWGLGVAVLFIVPILDKAAGRDVDTLLNCNEIRSPYKVHVDLFPLQRPDRWRAENYEADRPRGG